MVGVVWWGWGGTSTISHNKPLWNRTDVHIPELQSGVLWDMGEYIVGFVTLVSV